MSCINEVFARCGARREDEEAEAAPTGPVIAAVRTVRQDEELKAGPVEEVPQVPIDEYKDVATVRDISLISLTALIGRLRDVNSYEHRAFAGAIRAFVDDNMRDYTARLDEAKARVTAVRARIAEKKRTQEPDKGAAGKSRKRVRLDVGGDSDDDETSAPKSPPRYRDPNELPPLPDEEDDRDDETFSGNAMAVNANGREAGVLGGGGGSGDGVDTSEFDAELEESETLRARYAFLVDELRITRTALLSNDGVRARLDELVAALDKLDNDLVGLERVKSSVALRVVRFLYFPGIAQRRHLNIALFGPPGTGKTTLASLVARVFSALGVLPERRPVVPVGDRTSLVDRYTGGTALRTRNFLVQAIGRVAIIDEAYTLVSESGDDEFGREAVDTMVKFLEDFKGYTVIIIAGYRDRIEERLFDANEGLSSRFPNQWEALAYKGDTLELIFLDAAAKQKYEIDKDAKSYLSRLLKEAVEQHFFANSNGRGVLSFFEAVKNATLPRQFEQAGERRRVSPFSPSKRVTLDDIKAGFTSYMRNAEGLVVALMRNS